MTNKKFSAELLYSDNSYNAASMSSGPITEVAGIIVNKRKDGVIRRALIKEDGIVSFQNLELMDEFYEI